MKDHFSMGAVFIPLQQHEIAPSMHIINRVTAFANESYKSLDEKGLPQVDQSEMVDQFVSGLKFDFIQKGWPIKKETLDKFESYATEWFGFTGELPHYFDDADGIQITDHQNFEVEFISNVIQMLQINFDLPPIEFQAIMRYEKLRPDVCVGFAAHVEADRVFFKSTDEILDDFNKKANRLVDYIAQGDTEKAIKNILSKKEDLDAFDGRAIKWAVRKENVVLFRALIEHGARFDWPELNSLIGQHPEMKAIVQSKVMKATVEIENNERRAAAPSTLRRASL